jgi:hypothetical protein
MMVLLEIGGGRSTAVDEADMSSFDYIDKMDNRKYLVQYIEQ